MKKNKVNIGLEYALKEHDDKRSQLGKKRKRESLNQHLISSDSEEFGPGMSNHMSKINTFPHRNGHYDARERRTKEPTVEKVSPAITMPPNIRKVASKWIELMSTRRNSSKSLRVFERINRALASSVGDNSSKRGVLNQDSYGFLDDISDSDARSPVITGNSKKRRRSRKPSEKALIHYFVTLAHSRDANKSMDYDFVESLLNSGADVNCGDKYGQTILHEVARIWHTDVARFFIEHGSKVDQPDKFGRTPLHVAAAVDYPDMVDFLISHGASIHARTFEENQTPIHYAAKNDACQSLEILLKRGANMEDKDYKDRTPLQIAAELDRSETARLLVEEGAPVGVYDESSMSALVLMILKMPPVAKIALDQFIYRDRANRKQYFYLNFLEPSCISEHCHAKTSLQVAVEQRQYAIIVHPVFQRLIEVKWNWFGRFGAWYNLLCNFTICILWSVIVCTLPKSPAQFYSPLSTQWYRIVLESIVVIALLYWIKEEFWEYFSSHRKYGHYVQWREKELSRDLEYCHPRWPEERAYIEREIKELHDQKPSYFRDWWNYFDWVTYGLIIATIVCHVMTVSKQVATFYSIEKAVAACMMVFLWLRLMKYVRAFRALGPFVVMLEHVLFDSMRFGFLFLEFYIPYGVAFWVIFGTQSVSGYASVWELCYNLLQISVVGDYGFDNLEKSDKIMARLLCGTYIVFSGIVCLNLFIALLSDTFQRVYDNAKANAQMLRASTMLQLEDVITKGRMNRFRQHIQYRCAPEIMYYDDDMSDPSNADLKRMTHQIKEGVDRMHQMMVENAEAEQDFNYYTKPYLQNSARDGIPIRHWQQQQLEMLRKEHKQSIELLNYQIQTLKGMVNELLQEKRKKKRKRRRRNSSSVALTEESSNENSSETLPPFTRPTPTGVVLPEVKIMQTVKE